MISPTKQLCCLIRICSFAHVQITSTTYIHTYMHRQAIGLLNEILSYRVPIRYHSLIILRNSACKSITSDGTATTEKRKREYKLPNYRFRYAWRYFISNIISLRHITAFTLIELIEYDYMYVRCYYSIKAKLWSDYKYFYSQPANNRVLRQITM